MTIVDFAKETGLSKQAIYQKLKRKNIKLSERRNARKAKIVQAVNKKPSESLKKASKSNMKQAA